MCACLFSLFAESLRSIRAMLLLLLWTHRLSLFVCWTLPYRNSCALCECDDMSIPILYILHGAYRQMKASSRFFINILNICLKNRTLSLHYLSRPVCFFPHSICTGPSKNHRRVFGRKKEITSHQDHLYTTKYDISFFIFFGSFYFKISLSLILCLSSSLSCSFCPSVISFVLNAFLWDSWLQ